MGTVISASLYKSLLLIGKIMSVHTETDTDKLNALTFSMLFLSVIVLLSHKADNLCIYQICLNLSCQ